jgi:hypothetical protein
MLKEVAEVDVVVEGAHTVVFVVDPLNHAIAAVQTMFHYR